MLADYASAVGNTEAMTAFSNKWGDIAGDAGNRSLMQSQINYKLYNTMRSGDFATGFAKGRHPENELTATIREGTKFDVSVRIENDGTAHGTATAGRSHNQTATSK